MTCFTSRTHISRYDELAVTICGRSLAFALLMLEAGELIVLRTDVEVLLMAIRSSWGLLLQRRHGLLTSHWFDERKSTCVYLFVLGVCSPSIGRRFYILSRKRVSLTVYSNNVLSSLQPEHEKEFDENQSALQRFV